MHFLQKTALAPSNRMHFNIVLQKQHEDYMKTLFMVVLLEWFLYKCDAKSKPALNLQYRWLKAHGVVIPSEKKQRRRSADILGDNLESEAAFIFSLHHGGEDLRPAPLVFVPDLIALVFQYLEQNKRYNGIYCTFK